jgi:hypothetical protein
MPLLLTGFPPFGVAVDTYVLGNSSQKIVNHFSGPPPSFLGGSKADFEEVTSKVRTAILPVKRGSANLPGTSAKSLHDLLASQNPESVVCLGHHLAFPGSGAHLELVAYRPSDLKAGQPKRRSWFADRIADDARTCGITTTTWEFALLGGGTCNDTYWTAIEWAGAGKAAAFLHLPPYTSSDPKREEQILRQVLFVVKRALDLHSPPHHS